MILGQHLSQWPKVLFGNNPIDAGLTIEEYQEKLSTENPEVATLLGNSWPDTEDSFFHQAPPRPYKN